MGVLAGINVYVFWRTRSALPQGSCSSFGVTIYFKPSNKAVLFITMGVPLEIFLHFRQQIYGHILCQFLAATFQSNFSNLLIIRKFQMHIYVKHLVQMLLIKFIRWKTYNIPLNRSLLFHFFEGRTMYHFLLSWRFWESWFLNSYPFSKRNETHSHYNNWNGNLVRAQNWPQEKK